MKIRLNHQLKPFTHRSGNCFVIPKTLLKVQIFPTLLCLEDFSSFPTNKTEFSLILPTPTEEFTVQLDLEKCFIRVWGKSSERFWRYYLKSSHEGLEIVTEKETFPIFNNGRELFFENNKITLPSLGSGNPKNSLEKLCLGVNKSQNWDLISSRCSMEEIFPFWLALGQSLPCLNQSITYEGTASLLKEISQENRPCLMKFKNLFKAGFDPILSPRLEDSQHYGLNLPPVNDPSLNPLILLTEGARLIRSLFFCEKDLEISLLPKLPVEFHSGKFMNIQAKVGMFNLEWSKKLVRRVEFVSFFDQSLKFTFSKVLKSFRLRNNFKDKGQRVFSGQELFFKANQTYFLDCFEK